MTLYYMYYVHFVNIVEEIFYMFLLLIDIHICLKSGFTIQNFPKSELFMPIYLKHPLRQSQQNILRPHFLQRQRFASLSIKTIV